jgi:hypothetical protein
LPELYFAILKNTYIEQQTGSEIRCSFELPVLGKRTKTAPTARDAIRAVLVELSEILTRTPSHEWPPGWRSLALSVSSESGNGGSRQDVEVRRHQSKARQFTIGATMPVKLKSALQSIADQQRTSFADVARQLASIGFEDFDSRTFSEGSEELLSAFTAEVGKWQPSETEQIMLRLVPPLAVRLRAAAKEYRRSASEFGVMCLAHGLVLQTQLVELEEKVAAVRGAAIRRLAPKVGLGRHAALLSGVLAGSIAPPRMVLERLGEVFAAPQFALAAFFKRAFESRSVPAFKADNGKPQVFRSVTSWKDAVKSLNLPADQAKELLQLDE